MSLLQEHFKEKINQYRLILDEFYRLNPGAQLWEITKFPPKIIEARAYVDAYTQVINFQNNIFPEISPLMTNAEKKKTAIALFVEEIGKYKFNWDAMPKTGQEAKDLVYAVEDDESFYFTDKFYTMLYYWYNYERHEKPTPEVA